MARIVDKLSLLNIEHHRVKSHANILEVEKKWFSLMDGGWKIVEQADITTLSHEASESQSASPDQLQQQSSPTTRFSYSAALSSRLEAALALRLSLLFGLKNRYDQQQQHLYILPPDHLPFGNLYMLVKDVQTTGDKILFDFVAKLQLNSVILPPITEPDNCKIVHVFGRWW